MARAAVLCLVGAGAISACDDARDVALAPSIPPSEQAVVVEGVAFTAELRQGPPGERLTPMGAVPTQGLGVAVLRADGVALSNSEGRIAKAAAEKGCDAAGGTFNRAALGRYEGAGVWVFDGVCA